MKNFPDYVAFRSQWRSYQQNVLQELAIHLTNRHLHVIAPPGSGKTILGLEVALRLNHPTLILAPTISIRNQWIQRFIDFFLPENAPTDWISNSLKKPTFLTISTYQSLHTACSGLETSEEQLADAAEEEDTLSSQASESVLVNNQSSQLFANLKKVGFQTIVIDEAHHLKNEWWKSLTLLKEALHPIIVGLTATPPYDVTPLEWERYTKLCGPVDAEITVPELVVEGDLCPHQDYIYFSLPKQEEAEKITAFNHRLRQFEQTIRYEADFIAALTTHRFYANPQLHLEEIYEHPAYYSSILIFLHATGRAIPKQHLDFLGNKDVAIPMLSYEWLEVLLTYFLYKDPISFAAHETLIIDLERRLKSYGAIEQKKIDFTSNERNRQLLSSSLSKLDSIKEIVALEYQSLKEQLRMVVLTDYIRKEGLAQDQFETIEIRTIVVFPIFETLRRKHEGRLLLGVLTVSLVIIPKRSLPQFERIMAYYGASGIECSPLGYEYDYLLVKSKGNNNHDLVHLITTLFEQGGIHVLIGTKSLLGEGWDAPCINSLVLASFVGSFVSSNQMRGRAIRSQKDHPHKTGNIWHLVCLDSQAKEGGSDLEMLARRFKAFVGVSLFNQVCIENGIQRVHVPIPVYDTEQVAKLNSLAATHSLNRHLLKQQWTEALSKGVNLVEEISVPYSKEGSHYWQKRRLYFRNTIRYAFYEATLGIGFFTLEHALHLLRNLPINLSDNLYVVAKSFLIGLSVYYGPKLFKAVQLYIKHGSIDKQIANMGKALLQTLIGQQLIEPEPGLKVVAQMDTQGTVYCCLEGGSTYERALFIRSMQEILGSIDNPRYLLVRKNSLFNLIEQKDYHSVPQVLGSKKQAAEMFATYWNELVGKAELIYTRQPEGRKRLLRARLHAMSSAFQPPTGKVNRWR